VIVLASDVSLPSNLYVHIFMMPLRGLVLSLLFLAGGARRSIRIDDSRDNAQQQDNTIANRLEVSAETQDAFIPGGKEAHVFRRWGPQTGGRKMVGLREPWFRSGPQRAKVALQTDLLTQDKVSQHGWTMEDITPDGSLAQRIEGMTRKTWKFSDISKDRVQVALTSTGRPVHADMQLWIGPNWDPMKLKIYSEDGNLRPVQTLIGTRNKQATIEVKNVGEYEFPIKAAANYAQGAMAQVPKEVIASTQSVRVDGNALRSFPVDPSTKQLEVVLNTDGRQLNARIELLNAPNNPKQTFEIFTNNGELNSLVVCFDIVDAGNTVRVVNLAPVEFPLYTHVKEI